MKTNLTIDIALDLADDQDVDRLEAALNNWLSSQPGVTGVRVLHQGDLAGFAWREARRQTFGSKLQNPFSRPVSER